MTTSSPFPFNFDAYERVAARAGSSRSAAELRAIISELESHADFLERSDPVADSKDATTTPDPENRAQQPSSVAQFGWILPGQHSRCLTEAVGVRSLDAIMVLDERFHCVSSNQIARDMFGITPSQTQTTNFLDLIASLFAKEGVVDWRDRTILRLSRSLSAQFELRATIRQRDCWMEVSISEIQVDGQPLFLVVGHDVTDRRELEMELRRSRDFLTHTLNAIPDLLSVHDSRSQPILLNDSYRERFKNRATRFESAIPRIGQDHSDDHVIADESDTPRVYSTRRSTFQDPVTGERFFVSAMRDVTQQKKSEERVQLLAGIFDNTREGVVVLDLEGRVIEANAEFCRLCGQNGETLPGQFLGDLTDWENADFPDLIPVPFEGQPYVGRVRLTADGDDEVRRIYWGSLSLLKNELGRPKNLIAMFSDITAIEVTQRQLHNQALHDNLTGLPNRRFFIDHVNSCIHHANEAQRCFGVSFMDLDDFKIVNDTLGHEMGDELLIAVTERLKKCIFRDCFLARFGGDEFALLVPEDASRDRSIRVTEEIVRALKEPFVIDDQTLFIGVSVGTTWFPEDAGAVDQLLRHADLAMYHAKDTGKNTVRQFTPELADRIEIRQSLVSQLRHAIENRELALTYQPKACLRSRSIVGCEALLRWAREGQPVAPGDFIDAAERSGLILPMGDQVLRMAMDQACRWRVSNQFPGTVAVNLSPRQLKDPDFLTNFQRNLSESGCHPRWLELEITENAMMEDLSNAVQLLSELKRLGVSIAIDDFGTGYSSLNYLRNFPVSTLKVDMSFIRDIPTDPRAIAVVKTVLSLGYGLKMDVVAEGVETMAQLRFLENARCPYIQGYLLGRPMNASDFLANVPEWNLRIESWFDRKVH